MKIRFIGDIHGRFVEYESIIADCDKSIQVGDFGIGFGSEEPLVKPGHRAIRGNHDDPGRCRSREDFIPDGHYEDGMFFVGGAHSIDYADRTEGRDWWPDEECSTPELYTIVDKYIEAKPSIMITHDCPESIVNKLFDPISSMRSRTRDALQSMFEFHKPKLWIFGHWHQPRNEIINGTQFICLPILSYIDVTI